jgi:hypothetical protein
MAYADRTGGSVQRGEGRVHKEFTDLVPFLALQAITFLTARGMERCYPAWGSGRRSPDDHRLCTRADGKGTCGFYHATYFMERLNSLVTVVSMAFFAGAL